MSNLFNFGNKQRLHAQMIGNTSGREMFVINEYNERKSQIRGLILAFIINLIVIFLLFYFDNFKFGFLLCLPLIGIVIASYFLLQSKRRLYEKVLEKY